MIHGTLSVNRDGLGNWYVFADGQPNPKVAGPYLFRADALRALKRLERGRSA